jgi:hypothetical protein
MSKPKLCLNMIVKNEAHVITELFECVAKYINYYIIVDTGSTDNTIEVIKTFFDAKGIPGEIHSHEFRTCKCHSGMYKKYSFFHFGWNRTYALQKCAGKSEYIWVIDADDLVVGDMDVSNLTHDCYMMTIGKGFTYQRAQIFKNDMNFYYKEPLHEYPTCDNKNYTKALLPGNYYIDSRRLGDRSKISDKYTRDAQIFEEVLLEEPNNERSMFYCAQSYYDARDFKNSLRWYKRRIVRGGWFEETYFAYFKVAQCMEELMRANAEYTWLDIEKAYLEAYNFCKTRAEPFYYIAKHYRETGDFKNGYTYAKKASVIPFPKNDVLFIFKNVYDYKAKDELAMCAFGLQKYHESYTVCKSMLSSGWVEPYDVERIKTCMRLSEQKVSDSNKQTCCIYFGNESITKNNIDKYHQIIDNISKYYTVTIIGNSVNDINDNVLTIPNIYINCLGNIKFNHLVIWDYVNYFYDKVNIIAENVILYQNDNLIKLRLDNNVYCSIHNSNYLNVFFPKINKIVCSDIDVRNNFANTYEVDPEMVEFIGDEYHKLLEIVKKKYIFKLTINNETNGLVYYESNCMKNMDKKYPYMKDVVVNIYENIIQRFPTMVEHYIKLFNILYNLGDYNSAQWKLDKAVTMLKNNKGYEPIISLHKAKILIKQEKHEEAYELINNILQKKSVPDPVRESFEDVRDDIIMYFKDKTLVYPMKKIKSMRNATNNAIIFTITTCKRFELFEKTMNSFLNCCLDSNLIGQWLCVDDNSSEEDRDKMKKAYPFFKFIWKNESQKGHYVSMNMIRDYVIEIGATHVLHSEDDFHYFQKRNYMGDSLKILGDNDKIAQVLFNRNYAEAEFSQRKIVGGLNRVLADGTRYVIHEHYEPGTKEYDAFINRHRGHGTCGYWEGFSFRPSLLKVSMMKDVGSYYNTDHFERAYAVEYKLRGYLSAFFDTYCCLHIGKKTWQNDQANSYTLNSMGQFNLNKENLLVNILSSDVNMFKNFKEHSKNKLPYYNRCNIKQIGNLSDLERKMLVGNEFNYLRPVVSKLLFHINMFINCKSKNLLLLKDGVRLYESFSTKLEEFMRLDYDLILLDDIDVNGLTSVNEQINLDNCSGYLISKSGMAKILDWVMKNGVKNDKYLDRIQNMNLYRCEKLYDIEFSMSTNDVIDNSTLYKEYPGFKFYSLMDSYGNDASYIGQKTVDEIKLEAEKLGANAFNTLGWIKTAVTPEDQFINLPNSSQTFDGLYIRIP